MNAEDRANVLAGRYWQERLKEGGTIVDGEGHIHDGPKAKVISDELKRVVHEGAAENRAWLLSVGVSELLLFTATHTTIMERHGGLFWRGHWPGNGGYSVDMFLPDFTLIDAWCLGDSRCVWKNDKIGAIVTYCEGDLDVQFYTDSALYDAALSRAAEFYNEH